MKKVKAKPNQTVFDIALEQYGTAEAIGEILANNPELANDPAALAAIGIEPSGASGFLVDMAVNPGSPIVIDDDSLLRQPNILRNILDDITTFDL